MFVNNPKLINYYKKSYRDKLSELRERRDDFYWNMKQETVRIRKTKRRIFKKLMIFKQNCGLPWWLRLQRICLPMQETQFQSLDWKDSPEEGNSNPLQYSCLENSMDIGASQATVHGVTKSQTRLSD